MPDKPQTSVLAQYRTPPPPERKAHAAAEREAVGGRGEQADGGSSRKPHGRLWERCAAPCSAGRRWNGGSDGSARDGSQGGPASDMLGTRTRPIEMVATEDPGAPMKEKAMAAAEPMMAKEMAMGRAAAMDDLAGGDDMMGGPVGFPMRHRDFRRPRPRPVEPWAPVRVFPQPTYQPDYVGPRTDFRETVSRAPPNSVQSQDGRSPAFVCAVRTQWTSFPGADRNDRWRMPQVAKKR